MACTVDELLQKYVESMRPKWIEAGDALVLMLRENAAKSYSYVKSSDGEVVIDMHIPVVELGAIVMHVAQQMQNKG